MNRGGNSTPSSTASSRRPDSTTIILRLRLPEVASPPPQAASTPSSGATSPIDSPLGVVDAEGVLPPSTTTTVGAAADPLDSPLGIVDDEGVLPPSTTTTAGAAADPLDSPLGVVDAEGVMPPSTTTTAGAAADPLDSAAIGDVGATADLQDSAPIGDVDGEETPSSATHTSAVSELSQGDASHWMTSSSATALVLRADATNSVGRAVVPRLPVMWGDLLPDLVRHVACYLRSSRQDLERMRAVCPPWREAIPSSVDPFLVLSRKKPDLNSEVVLLKINRASQPEDTSFEVKLPLSQPPTGVSCWGSALGLMALQCCSPDSQHILVYCAQCGASNEMLTLPSGLIPRALYLEPLTPMRFILLADEVNADGSLHVDSDGFPWPMEGGPWWLPAPGFAKIPLRTMALDPGVLRAGADRASIVIIDESGRPIDDEAHITHVQLPPLLLSDGSSTIPWNVNGQHLFLCNGMLHLVQIFDAPEEPGQVAVRLLRVQKMQGEEEYTVTPVCSVGNHSVYLGPNQAFVLPSIDAVVGRMANTIYVEDHRGSIRRPQALAINIQTLSTVVIPFPHAMAGTLEDMLPAVWVGLPQKHDLFNHCRDDKCWRFWY